MKKTPRALAGGRPESAFNCVKGTIKPKEYDPGKLENPNQLYTIVLNDYTSTTYKCEYIYIDLNDPALQKVNGTIWYMIECCGFHIGEKEEPRQKYKLYVIDNNIYLQHYATQTYEENEDDNSEIKLGKIIKLFDDQQRVYTVRQILHYGTGFSACPRLNGGATHRRNNKTYRVHVGTRGGRYIVVDGKKTYI